MKNQEIKTNLIQSIESNTQMEAIFTVACEAMQSFPWFATQISQTPQLIQSVLQGDSLLTSLINHNKTNKSTIKRCRHYSVTSTLKNTNDYKKLLKNLNQLPVDYLPKQNSPQDQKVCFSTIISLNQLAKKIDCPSKQLAKPFLQGWDNGLKKLKEQTGTELDFDLINNMMQACFLYGVLPVLNAADSSTKEPTKEWHQLWFGHLSLKQLCINAKKWDEKSTYLSAKRLGLSNDQTHLKWPKILTNDTVIDEYTIKELASQSQLEMEGHSLQFCISSYAATCLLKNSFIFSIRNQAGNPLSTFEVRYEDKQFYSLQHLAHSNTEPSQKEKSIANIFVQTVLSKINEQQINSVKNKKEIIGKKLRDYLPDVNTNTHLFTTEEQKQLTELVSFLHPKQANRKGIQNYLKKNIPQILTNRPKLAMEAVECLSQKNSLFTYKGKNYRTNTIKKADGTLLCFVHDADKNHIHSYYGTVFITSKTLEYRTTRKSPVHHNAHETLKQLIIKINKNYQIYLDDKKNILLEYENFLDIPF